MKTPKFLKTIVIWCDSSNQFTRSGRNAHWEKDNLSPGKGMHLTNIPFTIKKAHE